MAPFAASDARTQEGGRGSAERLRTRERREIAGDYERGLAGAEEARPAVSTEDAAAHSLRCGNGGMPERSGAGAPK
jgi:hypothetical protein